LVIANAVAARRYGLPVVPTFLTFQLFERESSGHILQWSVGKHIDGLRLFPVWVEFEMHDPGMRIGQERHAFPNTGR
jgi:hypothetical protein